MSRKSRAAIRDNLARALEPPAPARRRGANLDGLLNEYAPPEESASPSLSDAAGDIAPSHYEAPPLDEGASPRIAPSLASTQPLHRGGTTRRAAPAQDEGAVILPSTAPHFRFAYEVLDHVLSRLDPYPRTVLLRLYRLAAGWNSDTCHVSIGKLSEHCKMGATKVRACLRGLEADGYIRRISIDLSNRAQSERGITFKVLLPRIAPPRGAAPSYSEGAARDTAPSPDEPNKEKAFKENTLTQAHTTAPAGAGVGSRFSLKQCIAYAKYRKSLDPGMRSAEAVGRKLHETGREDELIAEWLTAQESVKPDITQCPDCHGTGMYYPSGIGKGGVKKCDHPRLKEGGSISQTV
jgi:DNA-binding Lrp family transcriptional regulator